MPSFLRLFVVAAVVLSASGCAVLIRDDDTAADDAHVVFLTLPPCPHLVVKTQGDRFGIVEPRVPMVARQGDLFVGALRPGVVSMHFLPFPEEDLQPPISVEVHAAGLALADVQTRWREICR